MQFRERKQVAIFVTAAVIAAGFVLFRYLPLREERKAVEQERAAQMLSVSKAAAERQNIPVLTEHLRQLQVAIGNYEASIPAERALGEFLQSIASLMSKHDLREQLIQPGRELEADGLYCIPVNMQCKGSLGQIFEFYESLQQMDRLVRIEKVTLVNDSDLGGEVSMETNSVIYYRGQGSQG
jgi:Tfp pilus assembly protein PilO